jgi:hypothetical protein
VNGFVYACAAAALAFGCQRQHAPVALSSLGGEAARVGDVAIAPSLVSAVSRASAAPPRVALNGLVADALAAAAARSAGLDRDSRALWPSTAVLARQVARHAQDEALAQGAPREDELERVRIVHAIVLRSSRVSEERSLAVATAIRQAVSGARSADEFMARAKASPHSDAQVLVEGLEPFAADAQSAKGELDRTFVAAAFLLRAPADLSPVVETRFGWHVLFLVERLPPDDASDEGRRLSLAQAVVDMRARASLEALLRARMERVSVGVVGGVDAMMAEVKEP